MHPEETRVVLTHTDSDGKSQFTGHDVKAIAETDANGVPVFQVSQLWGTPPGIGVVGPDQNPEQVLNPWYPEPGAVRFRFFTFEPLGSGAVVSDAGIHGVAADDGSGFVDAFDPERPGMHISDSIDFVHVLSGEVVLELERGETLVKQGDVVIMRGGWHNWRNETDQPCTVASVMVGATRV
jgi:mannose-6-phosphate isomerase-like protein (cupin superfamily)